MHEAGTNRNDGNCPTLLDLKIELAQRLAAKCSLCERRCGVDRTVGERGFCGVGARSHYFFEQILWGEEAPLVPSHEVFFSGCNLRCRYCYSWQSLLDTSCGVRWEPADLAVLVKNRRREGAVNVNLIGGEPTVHLPNILRFLKILDAPTAVVWNSNFYMSCEAMSLLSGVVDLYVGDFRFGNDCCARELGGVDGYFAAAARNFKSAARSGDVIIRHLLVPGHVDCCLRPIAQWTAENLPEAPFNLMFQVHAIPRSSRRPCVMQNAHVRGGERCARDCGVCPLEHSGLECAARVRINAKSRRRRRVRDNHHHPGRRRCRHHASSWRFASDRAVAGKRRLEIDWTSHF